jgi:hypothetical protein
MSKNMTILTSVDLCLSDEDVSDDFFTDDDSDVTNNEHDASTGGAAWYIHTRGSF